MGDGTFLVRDAAARVGGLRTAGGGFEDSLDCRERDTGALLSAAVVRGFFVTGASMKSSSSDSSWTTLFLPAVRAVVVSKSMSISSSGTFLPFRAAFEGGWETTRSGTELKKSLSGFVGAVLFALLATRSATLAASFSLIFPISSSRFFSSTLLFTKFYPTYQRKSRSLSLKGGMRWREYINMFLERIFHDILQSTFIIFIQKRRNRLSQ